MDLGDLISVDGIAPAIKAQSKRQALQEMSALAARLTKLESRLICDTLLQRERLGSTGIGRGIAIPHARLPSLSRIVVLFGRLDVPIEFEAVDDEPVDLMFLLLAPEASGADHLRALSRVSRLMRDEDTASRLRASKSQAAIYSVLTTELETTNAA